MKASELVAGRTYVGKNGRRRLLVKLWGRDVDYDEPEGGGVKWCLKATFARWAVREATPEESAP
jgi:hypothetical protein